MTAAALPTDEADRLRSLAQSGLLHGRIDPRIKAITWMAANVLKRQSAALSLVGADTQTLRARVNLGFSRTSRADSFCAHAILEPDQPFLVEDASRDARFVANPLVTNPDVGLRFYAGVPVRSKEGHPIGALCVLDQAAGPMSDDQLETLQNFGKFIEHLIHQQKPAWSERRMIVDDLRHTVTSGLFDLHWQPISRADTLQISGYEALIRWTRSNGAALMPDEFIPLAETSGLIRKIDSTVLKLACSEAVRNEARRVSVNVSARWFRIAKSAFPDLVARVLAQTGLPPDHLTIELTERVLVEDAGRAMTTMRHLKSIGVRLALDDFGTGYSSLSYLEAFPFDIVKLDKAFVRGLGSNRRSEAVASAIIKLGHDLGMRICAEGVETEHQLEFLREESCDYVQGYLIGRPGLMPIMSCRSTVDGMLARRQ